jgi:hypothetical protein
MCHLMQHLLCAWATCAPSVHCGVAVAVQVVLQQHIGRDGMQGHVQQGFCWKPYTDHKLRVRWATQLMGFYKRHRRMR